MSIFGNRRPVGEPPQPPCHAYHEIANVLPESYFTQPQPVAGMILNACSSEDRITSTWYLDAALARTVCATVGFVKGLSTRLEPYDGHTALEAG